jgi:hypothetical protein
LQTSRQLQAHCIMQHRPVNKVTNAPSRHPDKGPKHASDMSYHRVPALIVDC